MRIDVTETTVVWTPVDSILQPQCLFASHHLSLVRESGDIEKKRCMEEERMDKETTGVVQVGQSDLQDWNLLLYEVWLFLNDRNCLINGVRLFE